MSCPVTLLLGEPVEDHPSRTAAGTMCGVPAQPGPTSSRAFSAAGPAGPLPHGIRGSRFDSGRLARRRLVGLFGLEAPYGHGWLPLPAELQDFGMGLAVRAERLAVPGDTPFGPDRVEAGRLDAFAEGEGVLLDRLFQGLDVGGCSPVLRGELSFDLFETRLDLRRKHLVDQFLFLSRQCFALRIQGRQAFELLGDFQHGFLLPSTSRGTLAVAWFSPHKATALRA